MAKSKKFDVNPQMAKIFNKFMLWYNQTVDTADELADIAKADDTESGEVSLKFYTSDTDYIEIKEGGIAVASDGSVVEDGEYPLADGSVLVIADGKFVETKAKQDAEEEAEQAPVAEEKAEDKEKKTEDGEEKTADDKKTEQEEIEVEAPYTLVPVTVGGVEFMIPQEVADYIHTLEDEKTSAEEVSENFRKEIAQMKDRMPSTTPVTTAVKQSREEVAEKPSYSSLFNALNKKLK